MTEILNCPFCGAKPHRGMTKAKHCQLHGDPYQDFRIWCPHGCAQVERSQSSAITAWNTRASDAEITRLTEALRAAEEREKAVLSALEEWMFRYFWRVDGMPVEAARIHAQSRIKIAALAGAKP